jgi:hypothetical protein
MAAHNSGSVKTGLPATAIGESDGGSVCRRAFSISEFCLRYGVGRTNAYQEIAAGRLRAVKAGRRTLYPRLCRSLARRAARGEHVAPS